MPIDEAQSTPRDLFALLYRELHRIAARHLRRQGAALTLGPTTLLHEAYVQLSGGHPTFSDRARFLAYASRALRGLVVDYARWRHAQKRGRQYELSLEDDERDRLAALAVDVDVMALNDALEELTQLDCHLAELVDLHFFGGLSFAELALLWGTSERTVQRDWRKARAFLYHAANPHIEPSTEHL